MVSFPISHRVLRKLFLGGMILAFAGVGAGGIGNDEIETAVKVATTSLQREMTSLQEQLELFEMKHETLQAASEQFRMQSKSAKLKLEEERKRYDDLASEKRSLENLSERKVALALEDQKVKFEETIAVEHIEEKILLAKENEELVKKLKDVEYQLSIINDSMNEELQKQSKRYEISEGKRLSSEGKQRTEISGLTKRLSYSEKKANSFEESWKNAVKELEIKEDYFQEESAKRLEEASRWEKRLQKLNTDSKDLYEENKSKELDLIRSKKLHLTLLEKIQTSDEVVRDNEGKIERFTADIKKLSNDLNYASSELTQSKKDHASLFGKFESLSDLHVDTESALKKARKEAEKSVSRNKELQSELFDARFELESSQNKTKRTIEEKSEMTKAYTEALEQLTSKNNFLRSELVDIKFELEQSQKETSVLKTEAFEISNAHKDALDRLESESQKLKSLQKEYSTLRRDFDIITKKFNDSEAEVQKLQLRIEEEATTNEEIQKELLYSELKVESSEKNEKELNDKNSKLLKMYEEIQGAMEISETKLLQSEAQHQKRQDHVEMLEGSVHELEGKVEELVEELELKVSKNTYLQKTLLDTKFNFEESQNKVDLLESQTIKRSTSDQNQVGMLEIEKKKMMEREQALERELQESISLYNNASRKINDLRDQLENTEKKSTQIREMYESIKAENDVLSHSLSTSDEEFKSNSANLKLQKKEESFVQCGKDLHDTQTEYSKLMHEYSTAKDQIDVAEKKFKSQEEAIRELKVRQSELEIITVQREKESERSKSVEEHDIAKDHQIDTISEEQDASSLENSKDEMEKERTSEIEKNELSLIDHPVSTKDSEGIPKQPRDKFSSFFRWLDYALYTILRVIVDLIGFLVNCLWKVLSSSSFILRLVTPVRSFFAVASWALHELRIIHDALVSLFEFEMTFVSSLVSSEKDRTAFVFLIRNSELFVMFGEAIAGLLCIDFIVSTLLKPIRTRKRRPKAKTINVPKSANVSLLRKANNM